MDSVTDKTGEKRKVTFYTPEADGKPKVIKLTSTSFDSENKIATLPGTYFLDIDFKLYCRNTKALIYDTRGPVRSDYGTIAALLKQHGLDQENLSATLPGFPGDISDSTGSSMSTINSSSHDTGTLGIASEKDSTDEYDPTKFLTETAKQAIADFRFDVFPETATLWGSMDPGEVVFARWRDGVYYSGKITERGLSDWKIKFDDGMEDVASEADILPIRIIGSKTHAKYSPDGICAQEDVYVVGSRVRMDGNGKSNYSTDPNKADPDKIVYAVLVKNTGKVIACRRSQLTLHERDAKEVRKQYQAPTTSIIKTEKDILSLNLI